LLTGRPKVGKTTLLKKIIKNLDSSGGFYTEEISEGNERIGFRIKTLNGIEGILAMKGLRSKFRLGKYGINLKDLEEIAVKSIEEALEEKDIVIIDEIGKMELFSQAFKDMVLKALDSRKRVIAVIHRQDLDFLKAIKSRKDVLLFEVNLDNHRELQEKIDFLLRS